MTVQPEPGWDPLETFWGRGRGRDLRAGLADAKEEGVVIVEHDISSWWLKEAAEVCWDS